MPPPSTVKDITPPHALTSVAANGFATGAFRVGAVPQLRPHGADSCMQFGSISLLTHLLLQPFNPIYRGLTLQFKIFIQMSAMMLGGCIFAEKRVSEFNDAVRRRNRALERSTRVWNEEQEMRAAMERREMEAAAAEGEGNP